NSASWDCTSRARSNPKTTNPETATATHGGTNSGARPPARWEGFEPPGQNTYLINDCPVSRGTARPHPLVLRQRDSSAGSGSQSRCENRFQQVAVQSRATTRSSDPAPSAWVLRCAVRRHEVRV